MKEQTWCSTWYENLTCNITFSIKQPHYGEKKEPLSHLKRFLRVILCSKNITWEIFNIRYHLFLKNCFDSISGSVKNGKKNPILIISYHSSEGTFLATYFHLGRNCNYWFSDGTTLRCYYIKKHLTPDGHRWRHCNVKKHSGVSLLWQRMKMKLLSPSHGGSQPLCFPLLWTFLYPKYSILCTLVPFHFLHFPDFVLIPSFIWTPPTPLLKLCFKDQDRSAFFLKLSLTVLSCSDFNLLPKSYHVPFLYLTWSLSFTGCRTQNNGLPTMSTS